MNISQQIVNGIFLGAGYAFVAIGWTILLGTAKLVNFAHGQFYMLGAFIAWYFMAAMGMPYVAAGVVAVVLMALLGAVMQVMLRGLVYNQKLTSIMIVTLGVGYMLEGAATLLFSGNPQNFVSPLRSMRVEFADIRFTMQDVAILLGALVFYALVWIVRNHTRVGTAIRAIAEDAKLAQAFGIRTGRLYIATFAFEGASVALAAVLIAPRTPILTNMGFEEVIMTFVVVVVGGIGSVGGALLAGFGLGLFIAFFGALVSPAYAMAGAFGLLLILLAVKPEGLSRG